MIDWSLMMCKFQAKRIPTRFIQQKTGIDWQAQGRLRRGETKEPKFNAGVILLDIYYDIFGEDELKKLKIK